MSTFWPPLLLSGAYVALFLLPMGAIYLWRKKSLAKRRSPLTQMLLRGPGESLRSEWNDTADEAMFYLIMFPVFPLLLYAIHITQSYFGGAHETVFRIAVIVSLGIVVNVYVLFAILKLLKRIHRLRLGYEGEVAIAQELNQLMREGAYVFHDVPAEGFNIDHVVVLPKGVFAIETKARMKPKRGRGSEDAKVIFDGQKLQFPNWTETAPLDQAIQQAKWLAQWLTSAVGDKVEVKPMLALPGWFVKSTPKSEVMIINGKNASGAFNNKLSHSPLSEETIKRIVHQLDQRCRDVAPRHFHKRDKIAH